MAYLNNDTITIDAILTKKGRELFSRSSEKFKITNFALSDDEVDYRLYDKTHPSGSNYYSSAIQNLPLTEALPDGSKMLRYKLITLPKGTSTVPIITVASTSYNLYIQETVGVGSVIQAGEATIKPQTTNGMNSTLGYTATLYDSSYVTVSSTGAAADVDSHGVMTVVGKEFKIKAKNRLLPTGQSTVTTTMRIIGNETGGSVVITINIIQKTKIAEET